MSVDEVGQGASQAKVRLAAAVSGWLRLLEDALGRGDSASAADLFRSGAWWKDLFVVTDQPMLFSPDRADAIPGSALGGALRAFRLDETRTGPRLIEREGESLIEAFVTFRLDGGEGEGVVRLTPVSGAPLGVELLTSLAALDSAPERIGPLRPGADDDGLHRFDEPTWSQAREQAAKFEDREPEVLVIGAGQAGLALAARLGRLGVDTLVVDRLPRIGDNWRTRYDALRLHNAAAVIGLPYFPVPPSWENYLSKDRIAAWLEYYADAMDIACWTGTALVRARRDAGGHWSAEVERPDGTTRTLRPQHLVFATGVSGKPRIPSMPGIDEFAGDVLHSSEYEDGSAYRGRRALVVGAGSSGHDIAQDLYSHGATTTMLQRGSTTVASVVPSTAKVLDRIFSELPQDDADLVGASIPFPSLVATNQAITRTIQELDRDLHDSLRAVGFKLDFGEDQTGVALKYLRQGGGFYLNVGCSDLIARRRIALLPGERFERFDATGARVSDGGHLAFDLVVFATGFEPQQKALIPMLGDEVVDRVGAIWGIDEFGFPRNVWRPTPQDGLWFMLGNLQHCRFYSKLLALQITAAVLRRR